MTGNWRREWRQFRLLSKDSARKLLGAAVLSKEADPMQFALWVMAVLATPPWMFAFTRMLEYTALRAAPSAVVIEVVLRHRMFFVLYSMLAAALLASLLWEALFPDREDQEVLGPLPVRPRTVAAARLAAAMGVSLVLQLVLNGPSALVFSAIATTHEALGFLPLVLIAHLTATIGGGVFVFSALLVARAAVAVTISANAAERLATLLQLVTVAALVEVFVYLPAVLPELVARMRDGSGLAMVLPPVWFAALYSWMVGTDVPALASAATRGLAGLAAAAGVALLLYLIPARLMARRALESRPAPRAGLLTTTTRLAGRLLRLAAATTAILAFSVSSLARSRRHVFTVMSYVGAGLAVGLVSVTTATLRGRWTPAEPGSALLALPLVMMFFVTFGVRSAFAVSTELAANWLFRQAPPRVQDAVAATRLALIMLAVCPVVGALTVVTVILGWPLDAVLWAVLFDLGLGLLLVECAVHEWIKVPFTCAHTPMADTVRTRWLVFIFALYLFAFRGARVQAAVLESFTASLSYLAVVAGATGLLFLWHRHRVSRLTIQFDEPPADSLSTLGLSEASR